MEAREAGKLLQDKNALDEKLKETLVILETVQNQRNELRQLYKVSPPPLLSQNMAKALDLQRTCARNVCFICHFQKRIVSLLMGRIPATAFVGKCKPAINDMSCCLSTRKSHRRRREGVICINREACLC